MSLRWAGLIVAGLAAAALATAYVAQYRMGLSPCELCLLERWPYRAAAALGLAVLALPRFAKQALALAALTLLGGAGIAGLHIGVEAGWWPSPFPSCNSVLTPGAPLPLIPAIPCDRPVFLIPHLPISMAAMDFCFALGFAAALASYLFTEQRRTP